MTFDFDSWLQLTGDTTWEFEALESIKLKCITAVVTNVEFWVTVGGEATPAEDVVDSYCLNQCNGNGDCVKGKWLEPHQTV